MPITTGINTSIKMCFWNIGGLKSKAHDKTKDPDFINEVKKYDLVFLAETHIGNDAGIYNIGPFDFHPICRKASRHNNRHFGGLAILRKPEIKRYVKILKNTNPDYQWVKLDKEFFGLKKDLYICLVYYPPSGSTYTQGLDKDILDCIDSDIGTYQNLGNIMLCGDFNARISTEPDFISQDDNQYVPIFSNYPVDMDLMQRQSPDTTLDTRGKELLDLCISKQIRILNGRTLGDMFGHYTCYTPNGASVVDYVVVSEGILDQILHFKVTEFISTLSDTHCKLEWTMSAKFSKIQTQTDIEMHQLTPNFAWSDDSSEKFQLALSENSIQHKLCDFSNRHIDGINVSVDGAAVELTDIILSAAKCSLNKKKGMKSSSNPKHQKWYDMDLKKSKTNLIKYGIIYSKFPNDNSVKNHYYKLYREYKKLRKFKYKQYKQSILNQLENLHEDNPKLYWRLVNDLKESKQNDQTSSAVDPSTWVSHFKKLNEVKVDFKDRLKDLDILLDTLEKQKIFNELDMPITNEEVSKAISKLKYNKSPGLDNLSNNMLKSGQTMLVPSIVKLFNASFSSGCYPKQWADGYITPIHKSNDISDPNNYRGIAVTSAIGKLFNSVLNIRLDTFLTKNRIINECQMGFTRKARTTDHMFILKCIIDEYCQNKDGRVYACFVDFQKAFDTVVHTGLKIKLLRIGVGTLFYNVIKNMYEVSRSCIRIKHCVTDFFPIKLGVKQGDNLSPTLFNVFINDLPNYLENSCDPIILNGKSINCLMYADDIILLSTTAKGLQTKLDILEKYCKDWCLILNPNKTKILIFNKAGRHIHNDFKYKEFRLECVQQYKYLGVHFSASGSFSFAQNELYKKALKAYFKLQKDFLSTNPKIQTSIHVFDHTVRPILLYGSEVWGSFNCLSPKFRSRDVIPLDRIYLNSMSERLHLKFCKYILGVNRKTTNFAVLSELGRFPMHFDIVKAMLNYWQRLEHDVENFPLLQNAYMHSKMLHEQHKSSWYGSLMIILQQFPDLYNLHHMQKKISKQTIARSLKSSYVKVWYKKLHDCSDGKLRTYTKIKSNYGFEKYLESINSFEHRRSLSKLRMSAHHLQVEVGRYQGIPPHLRLCQQCNSGEVEDEKHFLLKCSKYNNERVDLYKTISESCKNFVRLDDDQKLIWLLNCEDIIILKCLSEFTLKNCR